jgi:hypothetical protein
MVYQKYIENHQQHWFSILWFLIVPLYSISNGKSRIV